MASRGSSAPSSSGAWALEALRPDIFSQNPDEVFLGLREEARAAGAGSLVAYDGYVRPSELLGIRRMDVTPPSKVFGSAEYSSWSVQICPESAGVRSKAGEYDDVLNAPLPPVTKGVAGNA